MPKGEKLHLVNQAKRDLVVWEDDQARVLEANHGKLELIGPKPNGNIRETPHRCLECKTIFDAPRRATMKGHVRCPNCKINGPEREIATFIQMFGRKVEFHNRTVLGDGYEIDILVPDVNLGIEFHGLHWHTENRKLHAIKYIKAQEAGIHLIQIYSDEWDSRKHAVKALIQRRLKVAETKIGARKLEIREAIDSKSFYTQNHVQGPTKAKGVTYGLYDDNDTPHAVMTFTRPYSRRGKSPEGLWELARYATSTNVMGGASRLFKHFLRTHTPTGVVSYSDRRYFSGEIYGLLGFVEGQTNVSYDYVWQHKRFHKSRFQKRNLKKIMGNAYNDDLTERQMCTIIKARPIYNAGRTTWVWGTVDSAVDAPVGTDIKLMQKRFEQSKLDANEAKSVASLEMWADPERRAILMTHKEKLKHDKEFKAKVSKASKEHWKDDTYRKKVMNARASDEALAKRRAGAITKGRKNWVHRDTGETRHAHHLEMKEEFGGSQSMWTAAYSGKLRSGKWKTYSQGWSIEK